MSQSPTGNAAPSNDLLHVVADQLEQAFTISPQWVPIESASDVGVLAMTLGRLRRFTIRGFRFLSNDEWSTTCVWLSLTQLMGVSGTLQGAGVACCASVD
jgi:hypothetical protein